MGYSLSTSLGEGVHLENGVKSGLGPVKGEARVSNDSQSIAERWRPSPARASVAELMRRVGQRLTHSKETSECHPLEVNPESANEICLPSLSGCESILPNGNPVSVKF